MDKITGGRVNIPEYLGADFGEHIKKAVKEAMAEAYADGFLHGAAEKQNVGQDVMDCSISTGDEVTDGTDRYVFLDGLFIFVGRVNGTSEAYGEDDFTKPMRKTGRVYPELKDFLSRYRTETKELREWM